MSSEQTEGMIKMPDGSYIGAVGVTLSSKDIEQGDYSGGTSVDKTPSKIIEEVEALISAGATTLVSSNILKSKIELASMQLSVKNAEMIRDSNNLVAKVMTNLGVIVGEAVNKNLIANALNTEYLGTSQLASNIIQGQLVTSVDDLKNMLKDKNTTINASGGTFNFDTSPIVESLNSMKQNQVQTNEKIVEGIENQKETNAKIVENLQKKNEHLDFLKDGNESLKDSNGNIIKPRDIEAKKNAEKYIEQKETNETDFEDVSDFIDDILGGVEDGMEAIGGADGFNLLENPIEAINRLLLEDYIINKDGDNK